MTVCRYYSAFLWTWPNDSTYDGQAIGRVREVSLLPSHFVESLFSLSGLLCTMQPKTSLGTPEPRISLSYVR